MGNAVVTFQRVIVETDRTSQSPIAIHRDDVHVYGVLLEIADSELPQAISVLSREEQERAARLIAEAHRRRSIAAHAMLRSILSRYCGESPKQLAIGRTSDGKPFLSAYPSIRFNLSHSHGRALIAVARDREIGVDIENVRPEVDVVRLAKRFLSERDQTFIECGEPAQRHERFLKTWVAREAVFKAEGKGITFPLDRDYLELSINGQDGRLITEQGRPDKTARSIRFLPLDPGWIGAVAAEGTDWTVTASDWTASHISRGT